MRLAGFNVERFRALEKMHVRLLPMTVIIGENDVGKSSCLLALQTLFERKKIEDKNDFFKHQIVDPIIIEAEFEQEAPDNSPNGTINPGRSLHIRAKYSFGKPRVEFGEQAGRAMLQRNTPLDDEIVSIVDFVADLAKGIEYGVVK